MRLSTISLLLALSLGLASCSDSGTDPDPSEPTPDINRTFTAEAGDGSDLSDITVISGTDTLATDVPSYTATEKKGAKKSYTVAKGGYVSKTKEVSFIADGTVTFTLTKKETEPVTVTVTANVLLDEAAYADVTAFNDNSGDELPEQVTADGQLALTREVGSEVAVRLEGSEIETQVETFVFNETKTMEISLTRAAPETVMLTITPEIAEFQARQRSRGDDFTSFELTVADETFTNVGPDGSLLQEGKAIRVEVPADGSVDISARFIYQQERREEVYGLLERSLATGETSVSPSGDTAVSLSLAHIPGCSDGISNDGSEKVDRAAAGCVADDSPTFDAESDAWVYDPDDDFEALLIYGETFNLQQKKLQFVSSTEGERRFLFFGKNSFPESVKFAIGQINFNLSVKQEQDQEDETAAAEIRCAENLDPETNPDNLTPYLSEIIPDTGKDGWQDLAVDGYTKALFRDNGVECAFWLQHGSLARGEDPGDGNDDFVIATSEQSVDFGYRAGVEGESLPDELRSKASAAKVRSELPRVTFADPLK